MTRVVKPSEDDVANFTGLLAKVPTEVIEHRLWVTTEGEAFVAALRRYQRRGGQVKPLEAAMGLPIGYLHKVLDHARARQVRHRNERRRAQ